MKELLLKLLNSGLREDKILVKTYLQTLQKIELQVLQNECVRSSFVKYPQAQEIFNKFIWELLN